MRDTKIFAQVLERIKFHVMRAALKRMLAIVLKPILQEFPVQNSIEHSLFTVKLALKLHQY